MIPKAAYERLVKQYSTLNCRGKPNVEAIVHSYLNLFMLFQDRKEEVLVVSHLEKQSGSLLRRMRITVVRQLDPLGERKAQIMAYSDGSFMISTPWSGPAGWDNVELIGQATDLNSLQRMLEQIQLLDLS